MGWTTACWFVSIRRQANGAGSKGRYGHGQILLVADKLLVLSETGELVLVSPNPDRLVELGKLQVLKGKTWNSPALAGPYLLVRNHQEAAMYELPVTHGDPEEG